MLRSHESFIAAITRPAPLSSSALARPTTDNLIAASQRSWVADMHLALARARVDSIVRHCAPPPLYSILQRAYTPPAYTLPTRSVLPIVPLSVPLSGALRVAAHQPASWMLPLENHYAK